MTWATAPESKDGTGAGDRDEPYHFGLHLNSQTTMGPFTMRQYMLLLCKRAVWHEHGDSEAA